MTNNANLPSPDYDDGRARGRLSLVWLMPLAAVLISGGAVWQSYSKRGPVIHITFPSAQGIEVEQTKLRFRNVQVGTVEHVAFNSDLTGVDVSVRIAKEIAPFVDEDARFWRVEPQVSARGISGLDTVLSGVYIEGTWDATAKGLEHYFEALPIPPLTAPGEAGTQVMLRARNGNQLEQGAPILFNGIEVGRVGTPELSDSGAYVTIPAFVASPHDQRLTSATRFWDTSGFSVSLGTAGLNLNVSSVASLLEGGLSFSTMVSGGEPVEAGHVFNVFPNEQEARASVFGTGGGASYPIALLLTGDVQGLTPGADVVYQGVNVGEVTDLSGYRNDGGATGVQLLVTMEVQADKMGLRGIESSQEFSDTLSHLVEVGLRGRVASSGLLGQQLIIELTTLPDAPVDQIIFDDIDMPILPSVAADLQASSTSVEGMVERVNNLPIEELLDGALRTLDNVNRLLGSDDTRAIPGEARGLLSDTRALVASDDITVALADLRAAAADLRGLTEQVTASEGVASMLTALERTDAITADVAEVAGKLPALTDELTKVTTGLGTVPFESIGTDVASAIARIDEIMASDDVAALAPAASEALSGLRGMLSELSEADTVGALTATLDQTRSLTATLEQSASGVPQIVDDVSQLTAQLRDLPLTDLTQSATGVVTRIDDLLAQPGVNDIPVSLSTALDELRLSLEELRQGGAVASLNRTLASADSAVQSVDLVAQSLPALVSRLNRVAGEVEGVVSTYGDRSRFNTDLTQTLREITEAAKAARSLARTIERNPQSLITGR